MRPGLHMLCMVYDQGLMQGIVLLLLQAFPGLPGRCLLHVCLHDWHVHLRVQDTT